MDKQNESESYKALLKGIENGEQDKIQYAMQNLDRLWTMPIGAQKRIVADYLDALINGVISYNYEVESKWDFCSKLADVSDRLGMDAYEGAFKIMFRYDNKPCSTSADLALRDKVDNSLKNTIIMFGAKISEIVEGKNIYHNIDTKHMLKTAKKSLVFALKHGGPESKLVAIEAMAFLGGSRLKIMLDKMTENADVITRKTIRDTLDTMRARENYEEILVHRDLIASKYPDVSAPERFVIDAVYESAEKVLSVQNRRSMENNIETMTATRQLVSLLNSSDAWSEQLFCPEGPHDYEKSFVRDTLVKDIQNTLLHVVKRGSGELRSEAADALSKNGDERVIDIFKKIVKRRESGAELIRKSTIPKPKKRTRPLPPVLKKKARS